MTYSLGFGLPDLMSPISELRKAVADLEAAPRSLARDKTLGPSRDAGDQGTRARRGDGDGGGRVPTADDLRPSGALAPTRSVTGSLHIRLYPCESAAQDGALAVDEL